MSYFRKVYSNIRTGFNRSGFCRRLYSMTQLNFFEEPIPNNGLPTDILDYRPGLFDLVESAFFMEKFIREVPWQQRTVKMYGKEIVTPRLTAWFSDPADSYPLTAYEADPFPWTPELLLIKERVEALAGIAFTGVLLNYYRNGNDSVAWHSDNDGIAGKNRIVASVSFGQARNFDIRKTDDHSIKYSVLLENGSYLLMKGDLQEQWQHRIAKSARPMKPRVNLTFRVLNQ
jgi:alkylated DNA repair dioxygenase AlkB